MARDVPTTLLPPTTRAIPRQEIASNLDEVRDALVCEYVQQACEIIDEYQPLGLITMTGGVTLVEWKCRISQLDGQDHDWEVGVRTYSTAEGEVGVSIHGETVLFAIGAATDPEDIQWEDVTITHDQSVIDVSIEITDLPMMGDLEVYGLVVRPKRDNVSLPPGPYTDDPDFAGERVIPPANRLGQDMPCSVGRHAELVTLARNLYRRCYGQAFSGVVNGIAHIQLHVPPSYEESTYLTVWVEFAAGASCTMDVGDGAGYVALAAGENTFQFSSGLPSDETDIRRVKIYSSGGNTRLCAYWYVDATPDAEPYVPIEEEE